MVGFVLVFSFFFFFAISELSAAQETGKEHCVHSIRLEELLGRKGAAVRTTPAYHLTYFTAVCLSFPLTMEKVMSSYRELRQRF